MLHRFLELANITDGSLLDLALMTEDGIQSFRHPTAHSCANGQSTMKLFTAVCVGMLVEEGKLRYEDGLTALLPECLPRDMDEGWRQVTIHHALTHTTGIEEGIAIEEDEMPDGGGTDYATLAFRLPLRHPVGTFYKYSDIAYYLLSRAVEQASGLTLERFIRARLGTVLGLRDFAIASCPLGHSFGGGCGYFRASDMVKLGYTLSCGGEYGGALVLRPETVETMKRRKYALNHFGDTPIYLKTGAYGQCVAFSERRRLAAAWHRTAYAVHPEPDRNDTLLAILDQIEREYFGA